MCWNICDFVNSQTCDQVVLPLPETLNTFCVEEHLGCCEMKINIKRSHSLIQEACDVVCLLIEMRQSIPLDNNLALSVRSRENRFAGSQFRIVVRDTSIEFWCLDVPAQESVYLNLK